MTFMDKIKKQYIGDNYIRFQSYVVLAKHQFTEEKVQEIRIRYDAEIPVVVFLGR